jgi:outer membrane receptor for ferrienterochelin and colicins
MRFYALVFMRAFFLLFPTSECLAANLIGRVIDKQSRPLPGAEVRSTENPALRTLTDEKGRFQLRGLANATVEVEVLVLAKRSGIKRSFDFTSNPEQEVEFIIPEIAAVSDSLVVTGTGSRQLLVDAPVRTELISQQAIREQAVRSLSESLVANVPGLRIENNCQNCGFSAIRLNGLEGPYTQVLEDGLPTVSGASMVYGLEQLPTEFFENIEVVKGGASTLYGPNAIAGVINLVRREPQKNFFQLDTQAGWNKGRPEQTIGAVAQIENLFKDWAADFYYRGFQRTHADLDSDGFTELTRRQSQAGGGTLFRRFVEGRARLTIGGSTVDEFRRGGSQLDQLPEKTFITEQLLSGRSAGFLRWNHAVSPSLFYNLSSSVSYLGRASYYGADFDPNAYGETRNWLSVSDASLGFQTGKHSISTGFQYWFERLRDEYPGYDRLIRQDFRNSGAYVQDEWRVSRRLILLGGVRVDKSNLLGNAVLSPRGNLRYSLTKSLSLRAGFSTGFRAPQVFDEDLHIASVGGEALLVRRSVDLREEKSRSFTAAVDFNSSLRGRPFSLGVSGFSTQLRDVFQLAEVEELNGNRVFERVNGPGSRFRGVESNINLSPAKALRLRGGWTFQQARYDEAEPVFGSLRYFRTPNSYGFAGVDIDLPGKWTMSNVFDFTGPMRVQHFAGFIDEDRVATSPWFQVWNIIVGRNFDIGDRAKIRFYVRANNLTNSYQKDFDQGPLRDSKYVYGPIMPGGVVTGLTVSF